MRRLRERFSETKIPLASTLAGSREQTVNSKSWAWLKMRAMLLTISIGRVVRSSFCLKRRPKLTGQSGITFPPRHCHFDKAASQPVHRAGAPSNGFGGSQFADHFDSASERASSHSVHPTTTHRAPHVTLWGSFVTASLDRIVWSHCLQCRTPYGRDWRAHGARCESRSGHCAGNARGIRPDSLRTIHWVAADVCCWAIPGQSALRNESLQSRNDASSRPDAGIIRVGRVVDSSAPRKFDFAVGSVARRVTPLIARRQCQCLTRPDRLAFTPSSCRGAPMLIHMLAVQLGCTRCARS